jgi:probable rRNA maturation factor
MAQARFAALGEGARVELELTLQVASTASDLPSSAFFTACVSAALRAWRVRAELTIRLVDEAEGRALNQRWRERDYATNVLSFAVEGLADLAPDLLGDIVLCAPVVVAEAAAQGKSAAAHWTHLTVHGVLHLLGFDHQDDSTAAQMEDHERAILASLGYADPYHA